MGEVLGAESAGVFGEAGDDLLQDEGAVELHLGDEFVFDGFKVRLVQTDFPFGTMFVAHSIGGYCIVLQR